MGSRAFLVEQHAADEYSRIAYSDAAEWGSGWVCISNTEIIISAEPWEATPSDQVSREALGASRAIRDLNTKGHEGKLILLVDAATLVQSIYKGWSKNPEINELVELSHSHQVVVAHIPGVHNIADGVSRGKSSPSAEEVEDTLSQVVNHVKESAKINRAARSTW